ncbi:MAG TPA: hypothetical protein VG604_04325 [Candidatus Saccharimonadales bacterium]|nr:hypothetical protein [Candidatus Saccharimonadales bacterium]
MSSRPLSPEEYMNHRQRIEDAAQGIHLDVADPEENRRQLTILDLIDQEEMLVSPSRRLHSYKVGTAHRADQPYLRLGSTGLVISTEHGTYHYRTMSGERQAKDPETGIAGLGELVAERLHGSHLTILGQQSGDANHDADHEFKRLALDVVRAVQAPVYVSLHGMSPNYASGFDDERSYDVIVGIGNNPSERTQNAAERVVSTAESLGLRGGINVPFLKISDRDGEYRVRTHDDGRIYPITFAAAASRTMRSSIESQVATPLAAIQIELSSNLRLVEKNDSAVNA